SPDCQSQSDSPLKRNIVVRAAASAAAAVAATAAVVVGRRRVVEAWARRSAAAPAHARRTRAAAAAGARLALRARARAGSRAAAAEEHEVRRDDLGRVALVALLVVPAPRLQASLDVELLALRQVLLADLRRLAPHHHAMPLRPLLLLTVLVGP